MLGVAGLVYYVNRDPTDNLSAFMLPTSKNQFTAGFNWTPTTNSQWAFMVTDRSLDEHAQQSKQQEQHFNLTYEYRF